MFQSTPVITDGRTLTARMITFTCWCFNPRPSSLTGEPYGSLRLWLELEVSIHARHH